ncbi:MAG: hypothetical protein EKK56_00950 [Flavobacteriaceae bacterium]|nr:MAG: hypothetical protein EKK56_00950 [Flavobacteriaceae bacterium]
MSIWDTLFGGGQGQAASDMQSNINQGIDWFNKYFGQGQDNLNPFIQQGSDPSKTIGDWMSGYNQSPYAKLMTKQGQDAINNAAAISGQLGGYQNKTQDAQLATDIGNKDLQNYLQNIMGEQNFGLNAANSSNQFTQNMAPLLFQLLTGRGAAQGAGDVANASIFSNIAKLIGNFF